ncbi:MAG: metal-dependent hydrolase [Geminicoccaceae bacterium]|nr:metal-dependent hydrolase [Geminicoccaceae bacterium]
MDSLTQACLGAVVGVAVAGRSLGARRAALTGAVLGTLPDLDTFIRYDDPVRSFVLHRGFSHSLLVHLAVSPLLGEVLCRIWSGLRAHRALCWLLVFACLSTHALLDAATIYGTQLLWPLSTHPFGVGSIFIIDPLYTLPLAVAAIVAVAAGAWTERVRRATLAALLISTGYLAWSLVAQAVATERSRAILERAGIEPERLLVTPMPFNTLLWRAIVIDGARYLNIYVPLLGEGATAYAHRRLPRAPLVCARPIEAAATLARFSKGFWRLLEDGDRLTMADLRMGVTPAYVFTFEVATRDGGVFRALVPPERVTYERSREGDVNWLLESMAGGAPVRPGEVRARLADLSALDRAPDEEALRTVRSCIGPASPAP